METLESRFVKALSTGPLLAHDEAVAVAVSGGIDSVVMLHLFHRMSEQEGWHLRPHVLHLNHRLRNDASDGDADFVRQLSRRLNLDCTIESVDVSEISQARGISIESAGRDARLAFYERACLKRDIRSVALAHHADDDAETVLHRLIRGTGLRGLAGIRRCRALRPGSSIMLIRPMLAMRRAEIEQYARDQDIAFRRDESNESLEYTRNRVRNELLPLLRAKFNPSVSDALIRLAEQARGLDDYLTETGERMLDSIIVEHDDRRLVLHAPMLTRKPRVIRTQLIRQAILRLGASEGELAFGHLNAVADLAAGKEGSRMLTLPAGLRVTRSYSRLILERGEPFEQDPADAPEVRVATEGVTLLPIRGLEITASIVPADPESVREHLHKRTNHAGASYEEWFDADKVSLPLIGRSRRPGDRFFPLGMSGIKKLSDFFIDEKVDAESRNRTVVLCDQLGPIWIVPFRIDERVRLTRATQRILRLQARRISSP